MKIGGGKIETLSHATNQLLEVTYPEFFSLSLFSRTILYHGNTLGRERERVASYFGNNVCMFHPPLPSSDAQTIINLHQKKKKHQSRKMK